MRPRQTHRRETWPTCAYTHVETRARRFTVKVSISTRNRSYGNAQAAPSLIPIRRATRVHRTSWTHPSSPLSWFLFSFFFPIFLFSSRYVRRIRSYFFVEFFCSKDRARVIRAAARIRAFLNVFAFLNLMSTSFDGL